MSAAADAAARLRAQTEFDRPLLLEAGAGTGKTAVLVARIVAWCLGPGWAASEARSEAREHAAAVLRRVVAITFTDAATAEMARRVSEAFEDLRRGNLPVGVVEEALPPRAVREARAGAFLLALDQLRVHTIHAFCLRLLLAHPLEGGVHPRLQVDADGQAVAAAAREVLEEWLPRAFGAEEDADPVILADAGVGPRDLEAALAMLLGEGVAPDDLADGAREAAWVASFAEDLAEKLAALVALEGGRLEELTRSKAVAGAAGALCDAAALVERLDARDPAGLDVLARELELVEGWESVPEQLRKWARGDLGALGERALGADLAVFAARAEALRPLVDHLARLDAACFGAARRVLHGLLADVHERLRRRGVATFGSLLRGARDLLRDPELRARVRGELDQLLVDEFQDTDALQCEIVRALALDDPGSPRPTLFLVGDPKQSIYGWRNADLRAYRELRDPLAAEGCVAPLVVNFRSAPAILDEVTRAVEPVMEEVPGLQPAFERLVPSERTREQQGFTQGGRSPVEHWLPARLDPETRELDSAGGREAAAEREARAVAEDVAELRAHHEVSLDRIAILLRATADFEPVLAALRDVGIPYVVERETAFYQRREIVDAVALVRCVLDPHDQLALVATLRSSAAGVPDAAWLPLWRAELPALAGAIDGSDADRLERARAAVRGAAAALPPDVPEAHALGWPLALDALLVALHELRGAYETATPERFVEALRERVLLEASEASRHLGEHRVANLDRFFRDLAVALEEAAGSAASVVAFLRRAGSIPREHNEGRPRAAAGDAVHVLSIHRAKGLDWDHVYLLATDRGPGQDDPRRTALVRRGTDLGFVLLGWPEPGLPVLMAERALVDAAERVRLLYVATTRAKQRLVIGARRANAQPWRRARSHAELLASRRGPVVDWTRCAAGAGAVDEHGVRWRVVDPPEAPRSRRASQADGLPDTETVRREDERLRALRAAATERAARPFSSTASAETHARELRADEAGAGEEDTPRPEPVAADEAERRVALAAGTAVHAVLEAGDFDDAAAALERAVASAASAGDRDPVLARARAIWERFTAGPLAGRLRALAPHVVARELPVFVAPAGDAEQDPVGFVAGAIDLLYRDPETGELVVADYKTDAVEGAALEERAQGYLGQGAVYTRALEHALGLAKPPRFELWFLQAGEVVRLSVPAPRAAAR